MASLASQSRHGTEKGIVLRIEGDCFIFVWSPSHPMNELKFIDQDQQHSPGDFISFKLTAPLDHLQTCDSIAKIRPPRTVTVIDRDPAPINILVQVGFPPRDSNYFDKDLIDTLDYGVIFYCYCPEFGKLASIPLQNDWIIKKLGTMFILVNQPLTIIENETEIARLNSLMPWNRLPSSTSSNCQPTQQTHIYPPKKEETSYGATVRALLDNVQLNEGNTLKTKENGHQMENEYTPKRWPPPTNSEISSTLNTKFPRKNDFGDLEYSNNSCGGTSTKTATTNNNLFSEKINDVYYGENEEIKQKREFPNQNISLMLPTILEQKSSNFQNNSDVSSPSAVNSPISVLSNNNNNGSQFGVNNKLVSEIIGTITMLNARNMQMQALEFEKNIFEMCCKLQKEMLEKF
ncbi:unnamed protein product [Meloidogyne enterolobii]|uniref:Uncharacterized protein n=1 Tax=Meloidogyne enterolobii TaxID=390850 RepID=A0ACB0YP77_MELEN